MASRSITEKVRRLLRDRAGRLFGNSSSRLPSPLQNSTLGQELRACVHQTQLKLRATQSRKGVRRTAHNRRENGAAQDSPPTRIAQVSQIKPGSRQWQIDNLYRVMWNQIMSAITRAMVKRETNSWPEYFGTLRNLVSKVVMDSRGRGLSQNEKADLARRLVGRLNEFEKQW